MKTALALLLLAAPALAAGFTADVPMRVPSDRQVLRDLQISVESVSAGVAHVWVDEGEAERLRREGLTVRRTIDGATRARLLGQAGGYHTPEQCVEDFRAWAAAHPEVCRLSEIGRSVEGRPILALKITTNPDRRGFKPLVRICGAHHGNEVMSCETVILFTRYLLENLADPRVARLVSEREIWIIPMVNPDGVSRYTRYNAHGADLNRNYGYNWGGGWKSGDAPFSEPEVRAVRDHAMENPFALSLSFHCSGDIVNYVWNYTPVRSPDQDLILELSQGYAKFNEYEVTEGFDWYETHGDTNDFSYGCRGDIDWTIEVENPGPAGIPGVFARNREAILYILEQAGRGIQGVVTDSATGQPLEALVEPLPLGWPAFTHPRSGDFHRPVAPGTYALRVWAPGHEAKLVEGVTVPAKGAVRVDVALDPRPGEHHALNVASTIIPESEPRNRTHAPHALGPADGRAVSLGRKGVVVLDLGAVFPAGTCADVTLHEADAAGDGPETATVSTAESIDGPWHELGAVTGTGSLPAHGMQRYLKVEDASRDDGGSTAGYDLDAVDVVTPPPPARAAR